MISVRRLADTPPWDWPNDTADTLAHALQDPRQRLDDRILAASFAGDLVVLNDSLAGVLLELLRDPDAPETLRAAAATAFGPVLEQTDQDEGFEDPDGPTLSTDVYEQIQPALRKIINDPDAPKLVRRRALEASVRAPADWHKPVIRHADASLDKEWRLTAAFAMRYVRGFNKRILQLVSDPDPEIQVEAIEAAGTWSIDQAWPQIAKLLESSATRKPLLLAAIHAAPIRPEEAIELLEEWVDSDDEDIAEAAQEALFMAGLDDDNDDEV